MLAASEGTRTPETDATDLPHKPLKKRCHGETCVKCGRGGLSVGQWYAMNELCQECYEEYKLMFACFCKSGSDAIIGQFLKWKISAPSTGFMPRLETFEVR